MSVLSHALRMECGPSPLHRHRKGLARLQAHYDDRQARNSHLVGFSADALVYWGAAKTCRQAADEAYHRHCLQHLGQKIVVQSTQMDGDAQGALAEQA